jgi:hypothetical protein
MLSRFVAITLGLLGLSVWGCDSKVDSTNLDPGGPVAMPPVNRPVVDSGLVYLDMDADIYGGGSTGIDIPDAGPRPDVLHFLDAPPDTGGAGAPCDVFAEKPCATGNGCYPKPDGTGICQLKGELSAGSNCEPTGSSPDSRCAPGYICQMICTALCHLGSGNAECGTSPGSTCVGKVGVSTVVGYCDVMEH